MHNPLKRYYGHGDLHFITFSCRHRLPLLGTTQARGQFVQELDRVRNDKQFLVLGFVLMPEHVHLILSEPRHGDLSKVLQVLKQRVSRTLMKQEYVRIHVPSSKTGEEHFWQRRFYDFNIRSGEKFLEKLKYIHANPVERNLVSHPGDWPWSSWAHYMLGRSGLIRIDQLPERSLGLSNSNEGQNPHP